MKNTITRAQIDALMAASQIDVCTKFDKVTVVTVKLPNGFVLVEASGAVSKENYSEEMGCKVCLDRIATKLWQLEGYQLSSILASGLDEQLQALGLFLEQLPASETLTSAICSNANARRILAGESPLVHLQASAATEDNIFALLATARPQLAPFEEGKPLSKELVWMPAGQHEISAHLAGGGVWKGTVICDEAGARSVASSFAAILAGGKRVRLDEAHDGDAATAWVTAFTWDAARGIIAHVEWTSLGEELVRGRVYTSFSPEFLVNKATKRVAALHAGRPAGGLVNEPAFGAAMPALIAARLAGAETTVNQNQNNQTMNKETLIKILAALKVQHAADATEDQLTALVAKHVDQLPNAGPEGIALKAQLAELQALKAADATRRKADAKKAVDAAVARGALPPKDEAIQAKWLGLIEADPSHAELLAAMPDSPALTRVTSPTGIVIQAKDGLIDSLRIMAKVSTADVDQRAAIYARNVSPLFKPDVDFNRELSLILAANSLGTLSGELIAQRSLSLLKYSFPWFDKISTDFSSEGAKFGQTVKTRLKTVPGLSTFVPGTGYVRQNAGATDADVTIDNNKAVEIAFNTNELGGTNRDLFGEQVEGCHYALGLGLVTSVLANITVANFANESIEAVADVDADTMDVLDAALGGRGVVGPRFGLFTSGAFRKLGKDSSIVSLAAFQMKEIITSAMLPPIKNIQPYELFNMPAPAGENLIGLAGTSDALALATRLPGDYASIMPDVASNGVVQTVKNLDTGISAMLVRYVDHKLAEAAFRLALMWGSAVGNGASGQRLISAARA